MQKGQAPILVLVGLIALIVIAGGLFYMGRLSVPKNPPQTTISKPESSTNSYQQPSPSVKEPIQNDKTADWKVYISEDKTFSFKYPSDWIYETKKTTVEIKGKKYNATHIIGGIPLTEERRKTQGYLDINDAPKTFNNFSLLYATSLEFKSLTVENLVEELISTRAQIDSQKDVLVSDKTQAKEVGYGCQAYCMDILFKNNNTIFDSSTGPNAEANISTVHQILTTLKFTQ